MKKLLLLSICLLTIFNLNAQYSACHPDCMDSDDYEKCTERKIKNFISSHLKSNDAYKDDSGIIIGKIEIGVSITGSLTVDAIELSEGSEKQKKMVKEAVDILAYAITFDPASIKRRKPTEDVLKYNITFEGTPNGTKGEYDGEIFKVVEQMPRFPGCEDVEGDDRSKKACADKYMLKYIYSNLVYPTEARENNVEGTCVVQFIVGVDGILRDFKLVRDIGAGCGEEALRVVSTMNDMDEYWTPGYQKGEAIEVQFNLPLKFRLE